MNNEDKDRINKLNTLLSKLESNGFNIDEDKNTLDQYINEQITIGNFELTKLSIKDDLLELEKRINEKYNRGKIFIDIDEIQPHLNYDISKEKLDKIDLIIINHLAFYLKGRNNFKSNNEDELIEKLYNFIKYEYRIYYSSVVLDKLISLNFGLDKLSKLIKEDINKYKNEKDIYKRFNEYFDPEQIDKTMVYLISLNEDNYKQRIIDELKSSKEKYCELNQKYENKKDTKNTIINNNIYNKRTGIKVASKIIFGGILPRLLTIATLIGVNYCNFSEMEKTYHTTYKNYNEFLGEYDTEDYAPIKNGNTIIKLYTTTDEEKSKKVFDVLENKEVTKDNPKVTRTIYTYEVENDGRNIEDYLNIDLSNILPTSTIENAYDENMNYLSKEEFVNITIPKTVDTNDYKYSELFDTLGSSLLYSLLIMFLDVSISYAILYYHYVKGNVNNWEYLSGITGPMFLDRYHSASKAFKDDLNTVKLSLESLESKLKNKKLNKEELKELRKQIDTSKIEYQELLNRYSKLSELLEYNGYSMKLK